MFYKTIQQNVSLVWCYISFLYALAYLSLFFSSNATHYVLMGWYNYIETIVSIVVLNSEHIIAQHAIYGCQQMRILITA